MVTAYTKPCVAAHNFASRAGSVTGVTIWISARPCGSSATRKSSLSSKGRSGTMKPQTPALTAAAVSSRKPKANSGLR